MEVLAQRLADVRSRIDAACRRAGRPAGSVRLLPVSKTQPAWVVRAAYDLGCRRFGENQVQEAYAKAQALSDLPDLSWALIGHLQTNKARIAARFAAEFQGLDSLRIAAELDRRLQAEGRQLDVLIEVNSSGEDSKFGLPPREVPAFARQLGTFDALRVRGLMTLAANTDERAVVAAGFQRMLAVQDELRQSVPGEWDELSMGMSGDFELAIEYGATVVRVGRAIFGARPHLLDAAPPD